MYRNALERLRLTCHLLIIQLEPVLQDAPTTTDLTARLGTMLLTLASSTALKLMLMAILSWPTDIVSQLVLKHRTHLLLTHQLNCVSLSVHQSLTCWEKPLLLHASQHVLAPPMQTIQLVCV